MKHIINLQILLSQTTDKDQQITAFALLCLGIIDSLINDLINGTEALRVFFHAENCMFVQKNLKEKIADQIMSHGVQLPDLFDTIPAEEAQREYQQELAKLHSLCMKLIENKKLAA